MITNCISQRFDQPGYQNYKFLYELLVKAVKGEEYLSELKFLCDFYGEDICESHLSVRLEALASTFKYQEGTFLSDIIAHAQKAFLSEVGNILKLLLMMPATNATGERSFSTLRRVKSYLRSTISQQRLYHLMFMHVHKDHTDRPTQPGGYCK